RESRPAGPAMRHMEQVHAFRDRQEATHVSREAGKVVEGRHANRFLSSMRKTFRLPTQQANLKSSPGQEAYGIMALESARSNSRDTPRRDPCRHHDKFIAIRNSALVLDFFIR